VVSPHLTDRLEPRQHDLAAGLPVLGRRQQPMAGRQHPDRGHEGRGSDVKRDAEVVGVGQPAGGVRRETAADEVRELSAARDS